MGQDGIAGLVGITDEEQQRLILNE